MELPPLPKGTKPLSHQVAGHRYGEGKTKFGCLSAEDGIILKPLQAPPRGPREQRFYEDVYDNPDSPSIYGSLRKFVPKYHGTLTCPESSVTYLKLEDLTSSFTEPCITDIKLGTIMYDPYSKSNCLERSIEKFPPVKILGYSMLGMRIFDCDKEKSVFIDKSYCRSLTEDSIIHKGIGLFFSMKPVSLRQAIVRTVMHEIQRIHDWFEQQNELQFFGSSLLLVYEGNPERYPLASECKRHLERIIDEIADNSRLIGNLNLNGDLNHRKVDKERKFANNGAKIEFINYDDKTECSRNKTQNGVVVPNGYRLNWYCQYCVEELVRVKLIDFAHVYSTDCTDENVLHGIKMVLKHVNDVLEFAVIS
ncbi:inositol polyphosphate multikinase-like [Tubulanus polymorphus]|uniref:inositol polyphosphate multikinase-like n=1 Tax=Tubulanus polymorphus TaxID=672921 RepID=UPI003DA1E94B